MYIDRIYYPVKTLGYGKRLGIWTLGCPHHCDYCSNPELQGIITDKDIDLTDIFKIIVQLKDKIDGITITGGDPFFQYKDLLDLLKMIDKLGIEDVLVYTGYTMKELMKTYRTEALKYLGAIVDGKYDRNYDNGLGIMGSQNQKLYVLKEKLKPRYSDFTTKPRVSEIVNYDGELWSIGIPKIKNRHLE